MAARALNATEFEGLRPYLLRVAYSHLGSIDEAEDVVQEAWPRAQQANRDDIRDLRAWLTTVVSRPSIDALTSARARRERCVGPSLPEPVVESDEDPAARVTLDKSVSMAMLVVLESLTPAERGAFLLHEVFGYSFTEVARIVRRMPEAARQLAARARRSVAAHRPRFPASAEEQCRIVEAFLGAAQEGELATLLELLDPDVTYRSDGGGLVPPAPHPLIGADPVAWALVAMAHQFQGEFAAKIADVNGAPGLVIDNNGELNVVAFTVDGGRIGSIDGIRNPDKLRHLAKR